VVGRFVTIDGRPVAVVGVMPPDLALARDVALWRPFVPSPVDEARGAHRLAVIGRLRAGVPLATARAEVAAIARALELQYPDDNAHRGARLDPLQDDLVAPVRPALLVLLVAVTLVLVVGCANLAGLLLARAATREREMALRAALGAGRGHLLRQWMTESLLLAAGGAAAGVGVAWLSMRALLAFAPRTIPRADEVALDGPVLLFLLAVSVATGLIFGALPALQHWRGGVGSAALHDARGGVSGRRPRRIRHGLVVAEVALTTVLVTSAALLLQELRRLTHADLGFEPQGLAVVQVQLPETRYDSAGKVLRFYEQLRESVARVPGVAGASIAYEHPLGEGWTSSFLIAGRPAPPRGSEPEAYVRPVAPGYFRATGVRLVRGRDVTERDRFGTPGVVVINEAFARRHFPGVDPLGQRIDRGQSWWPGQPATFEVVGVVSDEPFLGPGAARGTALYYPHGQFPMNDMWLVVRGAGGEANVAALTPALRAAVWAIDPNLPVDPLRPMRDFVTDAAAQPRFNALLLTLFAAAALLLAAIGIYGVMSYSVAQRTREIGVRIALGAERGRVVRQVVGQGGAVAALGVALGVPGALAAGRLLAASFVGVTPVDAALLAGVAATLLLVAVSAAWAPAWRASRVDPATALRAD
jgi:putative ABC transport system permease protein